MNESTNAVKWFEIPAADIVRARRFYEAVFAIEMQPTPVANMFTFPQKPGGDICGGAIMQHEMYVPSENGVTIYLNADPDMQAIVDRIEPAGGKIVIPMTRISPEIGFMCFFKDTEGNRLALMSQG
jgi:hypothetical protein